MNFTQFTFTFDAQCNVILQRNSNSCRHVVAPYSVQVTSVVVKLCKLLINDSLICKFNSQEYIQEHLPEKPPKNLAQINLRRGRMFSFLSSLFRLIPSSSQTRGRHSSTSPTTCFKIDADRYSSHAAT